MSTVRDNLQQFMGALYRDLVTPSSVRELPADALVIGSDPVSGEPLYFTMEDMATSMVVAGGTGSGKSYTLRAISFALLKRAKRYGEGLALIDVHGSLATWLLFAIAQHFPELAARVFYTDFAQRLGKVLGCNPLLGASSRPHFAAGSTTEILLRTYGAQNSAQKPLVARVLHNVVAALIALDLPLTHARYFLERGPREWAIFKGLVQSLPPNSSVRSFWDDFAAKATKSPATADSYVLGPANRISPLIEPPACKRMLAAPAASVDFRALMDEGGIAIINLSRMNADVTLDAQLAFAGLLCQAFRQRFEERHPDRARPFTLVADEFGLFAPHSFADILVGARKFNLRTVTAFQALSQLIPADGDRTLHDTILAVPCKLLMGNLPFADCKILAEESYLRSIDAERVKHEHQRIVWDPVLKKVTARSRTWTEGESESESTSESHGHGRSSSETTGDGAGRESASTGESDSGSTTAQRSSSSQTSYSETESEQWITDHKERIETGPPQFSPLEEQVFEAAKHLKLAARGHGVLVRPGREPLDIRINSHPESGLVMEDIQAFLAEVFDKPVYLPAEEIDRLLEEREERMIAEATKKPRVVRSVSGRTQKHVASPVPDGLFSEVEEE